MEGYIKSVTKECHEKMLDQMNNSICTIKGKDGKTEIGLFCSIKYINENIPILLINDYIKNEDYKGKIKIIINNTEKTIEIDNIIYKNEKNKISMLKIKENNFIKYIEFDDKLYEKDSEMNIINESIYTIRYKNINNILISYGIIKEINTDKIIFSGDISLKYKFSPIFNLMNNKLIGIYENDSNNYNKGIFFKNIIN